MYFPEFKETVNFLKKSEGGKAEMSETMEKYVNTVMDGFKKSMILKMYRNNEPIERITEYADTTEDEVKAVIAGQG